MQSIYQNVKVLDSGARGATTTFAERGIGDVLITWENEAFLAQNELGADKFDIVFPSISILAEPPVAIVDRNVDKHGTRALAKAYIDFLYSDQGQELAAKHYFRPRNQKAGGAYVKRFPKVALFTIDELFGNWTNASQTHFVDGGVFDQISAPK